MLKVLRVALVALATLSTTMLSAPAFAGMVATPPSQATPEELAAVQQEAILKLAAAQSGIDVAVVEKAIAALPDDARAAAAAGVISAQSAGNLLGVAALVVGVILAGVVILSEMLWEKGHLSKYNP